MKVQELRVGNLILHEGKVKEVEGIYYAEMGEGCSYAISMKGENIGTWLEHKGKELVKGISLDVEWLERFGFEKETEIIEGVENYDYYDDFNGYCFLCEWNDDGTLKHVYIDDLHLIIKHVHELQNIYFLLTGLEFKI